MPVLAEGSAVVFTYDFLQTTVSSCVLPVAAEPRQAGSSSVGDTSVQHGICLSCRRYKISCLGCPNTKTIF